MRRRRPLKSSFPSDLAVWGARGNINPEKIPQNIFVYDSSLIFGKKHIIAAYRNAKRNFESGRNISSKMYVEIMLYLAGTRQISDAMEIYRPKPEGKYAILFNKNFEGEARKFMEENNLIRDESVLEITEEKISKLQGIFRERPLEFVLERMAILNIQR